MQQNNLKNWLSTGSNGRDALISGIAGFGNALEGNKYTPYMTANWKGNGLANTGVGYMINPNYRNYADAAQSMAAMYNKNKIGSTNISENRLLDSVLGKLSGIGGNLGKWAQQRWNDYIFGRGNNVGDVGVKIWDNQDYNIA